MNISDIQGWFDFEKFYDMVETFVDDGDLLIELGPWRGKSTCYLGSKLLKTKPNCRIHAVDTFVGTPGEEAFEYMNKFEKAIDVFNDNIKAFGLERMVVPIQSDSLAAATQYKDGEASFVFFDTQHTEEHLTKELRAWLPKLKAKALFGGHDIGIDGVSKAVIKEIGKHYVNGSCWFAFNR